MQWLEAFDAARQRGAHAFLFTGSVGDAFPPPSQPEGKPVDVLGTWAEVVEWWERKVKKQNPASLIWFFDAVNGFMFYNRDEEQTFRGMAGMPVTASASSAVAQAAAGVQRELPLPNDALGALRLMRTALQATAGGQQPTRCVVILPHADVLCPAGGAMGGTSPSALVALALLQIASSDALRRAGHLVLMAAPTAANVDEQLRRTDGPITTIVVGKPSDAERAAFVDRCCSWEIFEHQKRCNDAYAERTACMDTERERIGERMDALRAECTTHQAKRAKVLTDNRAYQRAVRARDAAQQAYDRVYAKHHGEAIALREGLLREDQMIALQLTSHSQSMDADVWKQLRMGDAVRLIFRDGIREDMIVLDRHRNGQCSLAFAARPTKPITWEMGSSGPVAFDWRDGAITINATDENESRSLPLPDGYTGIHRISKECLALEERRAAIAAEIAVLESSAGEWEPRALKKCREMLAEAVHEVTTSEARVMVQWSSRQLLLREEHRALDASYASPMNDAIAALNKRIVPLEHARDAAQQRGMLSPPVVGTEQFVRATQGLGYRDIATLLRDPMADAAAIAVRRLALLQRAYGHLLQVVEPQYGFEGLAGLEHVKRVLASARDAMLRGDRKAVPQGIFLMGPPGTGKTAIAHAFARECGMLLVKMRNIRNMFVGNSEQRVEEVCQALLDLAPCVCFRDETDQEDSGRDAYQGDSGVSARIRQRLMEFEADERIRGRVLFIKASNRPDLVDAAMMRDGRADERIVVLTGVAEYAGLFPVYVRREGFPCDVKDFAPFAALVRERGFSGAGVLNVCRRAYQFGSGTITEQSLRDAIADTVPSADRVADARMTLAAFAAANSHRSLPDDAQRIVADALALVRGAAPVTPADVARALTDAAENDLIVDFTKGQKN